MLYVLAALPLFFGIGMLIAARRAQATEGELRRAGRQATGTIVGNEEHPGSGGAVEYRPVVQFSTDTGRRVRATGDTRSPRPFLVDRGVLVTYNPQRPKEIVLGPSRARMYSVGGWVFLVIGVLVIALLVWLATG